MLRALEDVHLAAKQFEADGAGMFGSVAEREGVEMAQTLLVSFLRRSLGSTQSWPIRSEIKDQVNAIIRDMHPDFFALASQQIASFYMEQWYALDNFSSFMVMYNGRLVPTVEHAYQASKFRDFTIVGEVLNAPSAHEAKKIGNCFQYQDKIRKDWNDETKLAVMRPLLRDKHDRHEYVRRTLERSRGMYLVEDSPKDSFWGRGPNFKGQNWMGKLWMEIRDGTEFHL